MIYLLAEIGRSSPYHLQPPHPDLRQNKHCTQAHKHIALAAALSRTPILLPTPRARRLSRHRTAAPSIPADHAGWCAALKWPALRWGSRPASSASSRRLRAPAAFAAARGSAWCVAFRISENCIEAQLRITSFPTVDQIRVRISENSIHRVQPNSCMTSQQNATPTGSPTHGRRWRRIRRADGERPNMRRPSVIHVDQTACPKIMQS